MKKFAGVWRYVGQSNPFMINVLTKKPWLLVHRAHLHEHLKAAALAAGCELATSSKVADVDPHNATITLEDGEILKGDVIIGADGVHSTARSKLSAAGNVKPFSSGKNAFRFLISRKEAMDDPETRDISCDLGAVDMFDSPDRRVVIYPCVDNEQLNFVCIHPAEMSTINKDADWNQQASKDSLLGVYRDFSPKVVKLLAKADPQTLRVWPLLDMETLPSWVEGRMALIGDAAHPFLPYRGSGGGMAIEDAISLAVMLPSDVDPQQVPERLKLYEKARHTRATKVQQMTRDSSHGPLPPAECKHSLVFESSTHY